VAETSTRSETTGEALRLIVNEVWNLKRERVGEGELEDAKAYLAGNFPLTIETPDDIATQVLNALFYELPSQTFRQQVNAIDVDALESVHSCAARPRSSRAAFLGAHGGVREMSWSSGGLTDGRDSGRPGAR
jgi:zinc protease